MSSSVTRKAFGTCARQARRRVAPAIPAYRPYSTPAGRSPEDIRREKDKLEFANALVQSHFFPNLMNNDALLDTKHSATFPPNKHTPYTNSVIVRNNDPSIFRVAREIENGEKSGEIFFTDEIESSTDTMKPIKFLHIPTNELQKLYRAQYVRWVKQQTGKGKIERLAVLIVVGNRNGLLGLGEGKGTDFLSALDKAFPQAVRNMDYVERFENRTIWTEMEDKFGSTRIQLRPRPVGFGLATNPIIHEVFKVAGIKDASAKVWGSRNPYHVMKAVVRMLLPGHMPAMMGNGVGGHGRTMEKGRDMRSVMEIERDRGRKIIPLHT
ncbi:hypothetical protein PYCCODRAFT_1102690 [Trametes coccinea BRFM310]|uniref:S5 DRBM domain-containing protein n=1 Tax=Trametes coccinea (strain BRFM310) TaxID=1353009 RepID=A0A1Y2I9G2_TRAC3|nr:hypothetical protein PYCCODRAFT_1102690 [Trametes coccinea BRFM310]